MTGIHERLLNLRSSNEGAFIPFLTLGDPEPDCCLRVIEAIEPFADVLELGFPFSDPVADGPRVQKATQRSLDAGTTPADCFDLVNRTTDRCPDTPVCLLVYYNLVHHFGHEDFVNRAAASGADGLLVVDLPPEESADWTRACRDASLEQVFMTFPETGSERFEQILEHTTGFVYAAAVDGVTGERSTLQPEAIRLIERVRSRTRMPVCAGFGISKPDHVRQVVEAGADGVISGSAVISRIERHRQNRDRMIRTIRNFTHRMKMASRFTESV